MADGETLCQYLPALPVKGTGWHRLVFCLFEQTEKLDFSQYKVQDPKYVFGQANTREGLEASWDSLMFSKNLNIAYVYSVLYSSFDSSI